MAGCAGGGLGIVRESVTWYPPTQGHYWASITYPKTLLKDVSHTLHNEYGIENAVNIVAHKKLVFTLKRVNGKVNIKTAIEGVTAHSIPSGSVAFVPSVGGVCYSRDGSFLFDGQFVWKIEVHNNTNNHSHKYEVISRYTVVGVTQVGNSGETETISIRKCDVIWYPPLYSITAIP
jgi:hypothetical protein